MVKIILTGIAAIIGISYLNDNSNSDVTGVLAEWNGQEFIIKENGKIIYRVQIELWRWTDGNIIEVSHKNCKLQIVFDSKKIIYPYAQLSADKNNKIQTRELDFSKNRPFKTDLTDLFK